MAGVLKIETANLIRKMAKEYNTKSFIENDPVRFPRRLYDAGAPRQDVEISAFISSWLAYGSRSAFMPKIAFIHEIMGGSPYDFIMNGVYEKFMGDAGCLYRFFKWNDFYRLCRGLQGIFGSYDSMCSSFDIETASCKSPFLYDLNGIPTNGRSACKRLNLFFRWMVRRDGIVDMGIWPADQRKLIIPLDTHSYQSAIELGLTKRRDVSITTALEITERCREVFPDDPALADFALYGYGINKEFRD